MYVNNLSFDPAHPWFPVPGLPGSEWAVEVFTTENVYGLDPKETQFEGSRLVAGRLQLLGGQRPAEGRVAVDVSKGREGAVSWLIAAQVEEPIKSAKLVLRGLPTTPTNFGWWSPTTPASKVLRPTADLPVHLTYPWAYPGDSWPSPWICAGEDTGLTISIRDPLVRAKRFYAYQPHWSNGQVVELVCSAEAAARTSSFETPEIRLHPCADAAAIRRDFEDHLRWLEATHHLVPWADRHDAPPWADQLELVLTLHGQHWTGFVFNTFDQMAAILDEISSVLPGDRLLAYLPGWEGRYYWQYPQYGPGKDLGGEIEFARLVETARRLGVHLMPMFGATGANVHRYPNWKDAAFRSPSDRYIELINNPDWDNDRLGEDEQVFLNPGEPSFQRYLADQVSGVVDRYGVEGVFLDTSACWFDDPRHNVYRGYRELVAEIHRRHPGVLVCGEGWYDALLPLFPINQTWADIAEPPRFDDLPTRYSRFLGHLNGGAPGAGSTGVHEGGTRPPSMPIRRNGFVPSLGIVDDTMTKHRAEILEFCRAVSMESR